MEPYEVNLWWLMALPELGCSEATAWPSRFRLCVRHMDRFAAVGIGWVYLGPGRYIDTPVTSRVQRYCL